MCTERQAGYKVKWLMSTGFDSWLHSHSLSFAIRRTLIPQHDQHEMYANVIERQLASQAQ